MKSKHAVSETISKQSETQMFVSRSTNKSRVEMCQNKVFHTDRSRRVISEYWFNIFMSESNQKIFDCYK